MDGFKERLNARRELNEKASNMNRYDRMPDIRYEALAEDRSEKPVENRIERPESPAEERYDRISRRSESVNIEAIADIISRSGQEQLEVIEDLFRDAHSDRMDSERQIIDAISGKIDDVRSELNTISEIARTEGSANNQPRREATISTADSDRISRIEVIAKMTREAIAGTTEELDKNYEALNAVRAGINEVRAVQNEMRASNYEMQQNIQQSLYAMSQQRVDGSQPVMTSYAPGIEGREEIMGAVNDNRSLLNMIRQELLSVQSAAIANAIPPSAGVDNEVIAELLDKHYQDLEDHVHKECVKCYRNVQQALMEQTTESSTKIEKNVANVKNIATISLALNAVTLLGVIAGVIISLL